MAIRIRQPGTVESYAQLGRLAGEARAATREADRAAAAQQQILAHKLQMQRRELDHQWALETHSRARAWELERMELQSRLGWEREQKKIERELDERDAQLTELDRRRRAGELDNSEYSAIRTQIETGIPTYTAGYIQEQRMREAERLERIRSSYGLDFGLGGEGGVVGEGGVTFADQTVVPVSDVRKFEQQGYEVLSSTGDTATMGRRIAGEVEQPTPTATGQLVIPVDRIQEYVDSGYEIVSQSGDTAIMQRKGDSTVSRLAEWPKREVGAWTKYAADVGGLRSMIKELLAVPVYVAKGQRFPAHEKPRPKARQHTEEQLDAIARRAVALARKEFPGAGGSY